MWECVVINNWTLCHAVGGGSTHVPFIPSLCSDRWSFMYSKFQCSIPFKNSRLACYPQKFAWHLKKNSNLSIVLLWLKLDFKGQGKALAWLKPSDTSTWKQTEKHSSIHLSVMPGCSLSWAAPVHCWSSIDKQPFTLTFTAKANLEKPT